MNEMTIAQRLAHFIHATSFDDFPAQVVEEAKSRILDSLGTTLASRDLPVPATALKFVLANSRSGTATVFAHTARVPAIDAAFVNATPVNGTTHDDFLDKSHPGAAIVPAAFALAEDAGGSWRDVIAAVVLGYDLTGRAWRGGPSMLPKFRASGVAGAIGAAAAGKMLTLGEQELAHALGLAAMFASGFGEGFRAGTMDVKLNVGWARRSGVSAARLAQCGASAAPRVFEGESGFYNGFAGTTAHAADAVRDLGQPFLIGQTVYKERPACIFMQPPVELARRLVEAHAIDTSAIECVVIHAPRATFTNPGFRNVAPFLTHLQARIRASFTTAAALLRRLIDEYAFYYDVDDAEVLALAARIELIDVGSDTGEVQLDVVCAGRTLTLRAVEMEALRPTLRKSEAKFRRVAGARLGERVNQIIEGVLGLDHLRDIRDLTALLRANAAAAA